MTIDYLLENYGFSEDRNIKLNPDPNFRLPMSLSSEKQQKLEEIFQLKETPLVPLLEDIVKIVNDSIEYSGEAPDIKYLIKNGKYKPTGEETAIGDCTAAGTFIRKILRALRLEDVDFVSETCGGMRVPVSANRNALITHDCTVVYNKKGNWVVLNSKSACPDKQFYVASKDKLIYLGPPFSSEEDYQKATGNFLSTKERDHIKESNKLDQLYF